MPDGKIGRRRIESAVALVTSVDGIRGPFHFEVEIARPNDESDGNEVSGINRAVLDVTSRHPARLSGREERPF